MLHLPKLQADGSGVMHLPKLQADGPGVMHLPKLQARAMRPWPLSPSLRITHTKEDLDRSLMQMTFSQTCHCCDMHASMLLRLLSLLLRVYAAAAVCCCCMCLMLLWLCSVTVCVDYVNCRFFHINYFRTYHTSNSKAANTK